MRIEVVRLHDHEFLSDRVEAMLYFLVHNEEMQGFVSIPVADCNCRRIL